MKKLLISVLLVITMAGPRLTYAATNPYASLTGAQKQALIVQLTALLHSLLAQIAIIQAERASISVMPQENHSAVDIPVDPNTPILAPVDGTIVEVSPETPEPAATQGYTGPAGYSSFTK